jgi:hypothetical protein
MLQMRFALLAVGLPLALFIGMLLFLELGRRLSLHDVARRGEGARAGVGVVDSVVYSLLGLLIGFTFSGAARRFDARSDLVAQQVIAISTAWLRVDALPPERQPPIRDEFRRYVDALIASYTQEQLVRDAWRESPDLVRKQHDIWTRSMEACLAPDGDNARMLLLPALNDMFSAVQRERFARQKSPPTIIFAMLVITALVASLFAGYGMATGPRRNWMYTIGVAATISVTAYVILELEYPRLGVVRVAAIDQTLVELRARMQ